MRTVIRISVRLLGVVLVLMLAAGGTLFAMVRLFDPAPPTLAYTHPSSALDAQRQDLDYLRKLLALDRAYSETARREAERRVAAMAAAKQALSAQEFAVGLMQIAALADNGHTRAGWSKAARPRQFPVRIAPFSDGLYVLRARDAALLVGRIVSIDGVGIETVMQKLMQLRGGQENWRRLAAAETIADADILYGLHLIREPDRAVWQVATADGSQVARDLTATARPDNSPDAMRWYATQPARDDEPGWKTLRVNDPLALSDYTTPFRRQWLGCLAFVQLKAIDNVDGSNLAAFLEQTNADFAQHRPCNIVLDLRYSTGGDYTKAARFATHLPDTLRPGGHIYVLTSAMSFSATILTAGFVKQAGGNRVIIIGEPIGDRLQFYSEGGRGCLPNHPLCFNYTTGMHDLAAPCRDPRICFWVDWVFPLRVQTLQPDEVIPLDFATWRRGNDCVLARALILSRSFVTANRPA